jgi:hypothetical protein
MRPIKRAFWIEFWLEKNQGKDGHDIGIIKEAIDKKERRISDLYDIIHFIIPYIENMDIKISWYWRFLGWLKQLDQRYLHHRATKEIETNDSKVDS